MIHCNICRKEEDLQKLHYRIRLTNDLAKHHGGYSLLLCPSCMRISAYKTIALCSCGRVFFKEGNHSKVYDKVDVCERCK